MRLAPVALAAVLALSTSGCAAFSDGSSASDGGSDGGGGGKVEVAAAFYPLAYLAQEVGGDQVEVTNLTSPGAEPHDLELTVQETAAIQEASLVVVEHGLQPAVDDAVDQKSGGTVLDAADVVDLIPVSEEHSHEDHGDEDHGDEDHGDEEHAEEGEGIDDGHDHGDVDPHFWQDPTRMATLAGAVADDLAEIDPDHAEEFRANAEALKGRLADLDAAYAQGLSSCQRDTIVVSHDAFSYLEKYGLHVEGIAGLSPDAEPTPADLQRLQELIRTDGITTVFGERLVSPKIGEQLAADLGITTAVLDPVEGLSEETSGQDYLSLMQQNLSALQTANGCA